MYPPPADPWGEQQDPPPTKPTKVTQPGPSGPPPTYARAAVPVPPPLREPTAEYPATYPATDPRRPVGSRSNRPVSWQRTSRASLRSLADGWGFTAAGLIVTFSGWGIWAAAGRGTGLQPLPGLILTLIVGAGVFVLSRLVGYVLIVRGLGRTRTHARWSHFLTFAFLMTAGGAYLLSTSWITDADDWVRQGFNWVGEWWARA